LPSRSRHHILLQVRLRRPSDSEIAAVLRAREHWFSYPEVGKTAELGAPEIEASIASRYDLDRHRFALGRGRDLFERAHASLLAWRHFEIPWLEFHGAHGVASGQVVATLTSVAGLWFLNPCRVVYVDAPPDRQTVSFAYGTLRGHAECGEERFQVSFDAGTEAVSYEISAFSRPAIMSTKLGYPLARRIQRRFARSSAEALARAVG
jgi:uncharacterized protein (UPF0548 family)